MPRMIDSFGAAEDEELEEPVVEEEAPPRASPEAAISAIRAQLDRLEALLAGE